MQQCPSCEREFDSSRGVSVHHARTHGESISGTIVDCDSCGDPINRNPSHINDKNFCDYECKGEWQRNNLKGSDNPRYSKISTKCENCGNSLKRKKCREGKRHFCDQSCQGEWRSENLTGKDAWAYKDGSSLENYYNTPEWKQFRRRMKEELNICCSICGDNGERQNALHHIIRMGDFEERNQANFKQNVVFLCQSHHMELESESVEKQIERLKGDSHVPNDVEELRSISDES